MFRKFVLAIGAFLGLGASSFEAERKKWQGYGGGSYHTRARPRRRVFKRGRTPKLLRRIRMYQGRGMTTGDY